MRSLAFFIIGFCSFAAIDRGLTVLHRSGAPPPAAVTSTGPTREKLESLQELVIQKVTVADILTYTEGSVSAAWLVRGDGLISVSLRDAIIDHIDQTARTATIRLPVPKVLSARVDHERTTFWDSRQGLWNRINPWGVSLPTVETRAMLAAQQLVELAVDSPEHHQQARALTTTLITNLYSALGWSITIAWREADRAGPVAGTSELRPQEGSGQ